MYKMNPKNLVSILFMSVCFLHFSCKRQSNTTVTPAVVTDIYVSGFKAANNTVIGAVYWKNGQMVNLPGGNNATTTGITVVGNDVYVVGMSDNHAALWKNGTLTLLSTQISKANAITVNNNNIYIAGSVNTNAAYWKNEVETDLVDPVNITQANSIAVNGNNIYLAGETTPAAYNDLQAAYWINGNMTRLSDIYGGSNAVSVYVSGSDVYVTGNERSNARCWKNGVAMSLDSTSDETFPSGATGAVIYKGDLYVAGGFANACAYWKNGVLNRIGSTSVGITEILAENGDLYMLGNYVGNNVVWRNKDQAVTMQPISEYGVSGMFVITH